MQYSPEVYAAEKREVGCDASMQSVRRQDAQDQLKEHVSANNYSEFWTELSRLERRNDMYIYCSHLTF